MMVGGSVSCLAVMPDGQHCVVGMDRLGQMRIYDMNGTQINSFSVTHDGIGGRGGMGKAVAAVAMTRDGQHLIAGASKVVKVWGDLDVPQVKSSPAKGEPACPGTRLI